MVPNRKIERSNTEEKTPESIIPSRDDNLSILFAVMESLGSYTQESGRLAAGLIAENLNSSYLGDVQAGFKNDVFCTAEHPHHSDRP